MLRKIPISCLWQTICPLDSSGDAGTRQQNGKHNSKVLNLYLLSPGPPLCYVAPTLAPGHKGHLAPRRRALGTIIKKSSHGCRRLATRLGSKTLKPPPWVSGEPKLKTWLQAPPGRDFSLSPLGAFRRDAPALFRVRSPNNGKVGNQVLCWLFFQVNLIPINNPHRPSLATSECAERWS